MTILIYICFVFLIGLTVLYLQQVSKSAFCLMWYQWCTNDSIFNSSTNATNTTKIVTTNSDKCKINIILKRNVQEYFKKDFIVRFVIKYFIFLYSK